MAQTEIISSRKGVKNAERDREIGEILNRFSQFVQAKDLAGLLELFSDEVVIFDLQTPFQYVGSRALMSRLSDWFKSYERGISYDFDQLRIHSTDSLAVAHALVKCSGVLNGDARRTEMWMRVTFTFMKTGGDWLIVHQHSSEPFDMETGRVISQRDEGEDEVPPSPSRVAATFPEFRKGTRYLFLLRGFLLLVLEDLGELRAEALDGLGVELRDA